MRIPLTMLIVFITAAQTNIYPQQENKKSVLKITDVWAHPAVAHMNSAIYLTIDNLGSKADTLTGVESDAADIVQVHETFKRSNDRMGMRQVDFVSIPPKSKVEFKPGGYHVMLIDMQKDYGIGSTIKGVLIFKHAGKIPITADVKAMAESSEMQH
jgi:copper(I)-binding protein